MPPPPLTVLEEPGSFFDVIGEIVESLQLMSTFDAMAEGILQQGDRTCMVAVIATIGQEVGMTSIQRLRAYSRGDFGNESISSRKKT